MPQGVIQINPTTITIQADDEVSQIIKRLVPNHNIRPLRISRHLDNYRLLRMVMREYTLVPSDTKAWEDCIAEFQHAQDRATALTNLKSREGTEYFLGKLLPFQKLGLDFLMKTDGIALLADEMGLGKTVQTLAFLSHNLPSYRHPCVIITPLVTLENWRREILKFLQIYSDCGLFVNCKDSPVVETIRTGKQKLSGQAHIYIMNYELASKHVETIQSLQPQTIIYDEVQNLRNNNTIRYTSCDDISNYESVKHRIGLSGTPIYNKGIEMYNISEILSPGVMGDRNEYIRKYCTNWNHSVTDTNSNKRSQLASFLSKTLMLRRKKVDVLPDLPEKNRIQQTVKIDVDMYEEKLREMYMKILEAKREMASDEDTDDSAFNKLISNVSIQERQIAGLAKAPFVVEYLQELLDDYEEEKFVVFCHHRLVHTAIYDGLKWYKPTQVIGGQTDKQRQQAIDSFMKWDSRVIICGLRAGNVGINLTESAYVVFAELDWSPSIHRQAEDRLHRIGQKRTVFSHYLVGEGTFDERVVPILLNKEHEIANALGDKVEHVDNAKTLKMLEDRFMKNKKGQNLISNDLATIGR